MEKIAAAAIKDGKGVVHQLPPPNRHGDVMGMMVSRRDWTDDESKQIQGFVTDSGRFVTREEALVIAREAGQIIRRCGGDHYMLSTEGLW